MFTLVCILKCGIQNGTRAFMVKAIQTHVQILREVVVVPVGADVLSIR